MHKTFQSVLSLTLGAIYEKKKDEQTGKTDKT